MFEELDALPLDQANRQILDEIDELKARMSELGRYRAARVAREAAARGRHGAVEVAAELGVERAAVYRLIVEARKHQA